MVAYITVGAKTTHGGTVITGSPQTTHYGIPIARKGDKVVCKKCKKVVTIITGDPSYIVDGAPVARAGDMTSCGSKLIASQQAFSESGFDVGSISDEMTDEELYALNDQMIEDAIADGGLMAFSSTKGLTNDSKAPKKPTKYNKDGTEKTQKQINDAWKAYYDHKHKVEAEALARQKEEEKSFFDKAKDFLGFDDDAQADNAINTARNAAVTGAKLPGTGTMAAGDTLLGAGAAIYSAPDTAMRQDYEYFIRTGEQAPLNKAATLFPVYNRSRQRINKEFVEKHKGADWTEPGKDGRSPQNDLWGK